MTTWSRPSSALSVTSPAPHDADTYDHASLRRSGHTLAAAMSNENAVSTKRGRAVTVSNRSAADRDGVVAALGSHPMAALVAAPPR
jgi:hypothetical protein